MIGIKELKNNILILQKRVREVCAVFDEVAAAERIAILQKQSEVDGFWGDPQVAGKVMQELEGLKKQKNTFGGIQKNVDELLEMVSLATEADVTLYAEEYKTLLDIVDTLDQASLFAGPYDTHDAIVTVYAGAGGTDAQDWTGMLLRMYLRWAERSGRSTTIIDESRGAEAGYKSVTFEICGQMAYGHLHTEMGTHRLVRLSPFNSDSLRQTSFARVEVLPVLKQDTDEIVLDTQEIRIDTFRSQGAGGQSVNTTDSAVRITHIPSGLVASCQNERSQLQNKEHAMRVLRGKLFAKKMEEQRQERMALRGENVSAEWGSQIRSYVLHPYKMVKDHRTGHETPQTQDVLDGELDAFIDVALRWHVRQEHGIIAT